ncbi:Uma2 family endonuclease [Kitasatospora sp. NPDC002965]|uniref:Uma2 family endonuclease n=1 Tax=Kitasatospora sp. NPDC002965 TaxID=3154775 RepID=UPI0033A2A03B
MSTDPAACARLHEIADRLPRIPGTGKAEIADGGIVMTTSPVKRHELAVVRVARQLNARLPQARPGHITHGSADLEDVGLGRLRNPDLMVFPEVALDEEECALLPHEVLLVVEIVSKSNPENDHHAKVRNHAVMGIPLHLLVDPRKGTGVVHDEPDCTSRRESAFGDSVAVGPWTLDTWGPCTYA